MNQPIAFLGLGVMGSAMGANLARAGWVVQAWNRTGDRPSVQVAAAAGATIAPTLEAAVTGAAMIFSCLGDVPDVVEVLTAVAAIAAPGTLIIDMSTIGPVAARTLATQLGSAGLRFMDAPVSGGDVGAQRGTLTIMAGGTAADFATAKPALEVMGSTIRHCGPVGSGQAVKLCNQVLASLHTLALCEAVHLAETQGIDPQVMVELCSTGAAGSWTLANLGPRLLAGDLDPGFAIAHMVKDLRLVREAIADPDQTLPGLAVAHTQFQRVCQLDAEAGADLGTQGLIRAYRP